MEIDRHRDSKRKKKKVRKKKKKEERGWKREGVEEEERERRKRRRRREERKEERHVCQYRESKQLWAQHPILVAWLARRSSAPHASTQNTYKHMQRGMDKDRVNGTTNAEKSVQPRAQPHSNNHRNRYHITLFHRLTITLKNVTVSFVFLISRV